MNQQLRISMTCALPLEAVMKQHFIVGQSSSGKTNAAVVLVEEFAKFDQQFVVIDEPGVWWGLRSSMDGKRDGLAVILLGGEHGDMSLDPSSGAVIADFVVQSGLSFVLDLSLMSRAKWSVFMVDFCTRLYEAKAKLKTPLHLVLDEADLFIPEVPSEKTTGKFLLESIDNMARRGRSRGLRLTLVTQRPQVINKSIIAQSDILHVFRLSHPLDRKALDAWVRGNATEDELESFTDEIASLETGYCFLWSPHWLKVFKKIHVRRRETFDSSTTPEVGVKVLRPTKMTSVDLSALKKNLAETIDVAKLEDPAMLRAQIVELKGQLAALEARKAQPKVERVAYVPKAVRNALVSTLSALREQVHVLEKAAELARMCPDEEAPHVVDAVDTADAAKRVAEGIWNASIGRGVSSRSAPASATTLRAVTERALQKIAPEPVKIAGLRKGERRILAVAARVHPVRLTKAQLGQLSKLATKSGTYGAYLSTLKRAGYLDEEKDLFGATAEGLAAAGVTTKKRLSREERIDLWRGVLRAGERAMFDVVRERGTVTRSELAEAVNLAVSAGTFGAYLSVLRRNDIVVVSGDLVSRGGVFA